MLPWLRIIPIGGVGAAVLILVLALTPPREPRHGVSPEMVLARGALIDRGEHPEWPQFLIQTAFRRAGELLKLRDLPDTPTLTEPIMLPRERPVIAASPPPDSGVQSAAKALDVATRDDTPAAPPAPAPIQIAKLPAAVEPVKPAPPATPIDASAAELAQQPAPSTAAAPSPAATPSEPETKVAVLPQERPAIDSDSDVTGTISAANDATIPVDIGETSSTELPIVLPPERPPVLHIIEREHSSRATPRKRSPRRARTAAKLVRPAKQSNVQPASEVNLFESLLDNSKSTQRTAAVPAAKRGKAPSTDNPSYPPVVTYPFSAK